MKEPVVLSWSGGKDSALALHELRGSGDWEVAGLLTTVTADYQRISMHGVRRVLLEAQARALGLPLTVVEISAGAPNDEYESRMATALHALRDQGVEAVGFGDLFLEDIRRYREAMVQRAGMRAVFPVWGRDTHRLSRDFLALGFRAVAVCVDTHALDPAFAGRPYDAAFLSDLPPHADPCGENGEFHTFVSDGPGFAHPVTHTTGKRILRDDRFQFCDLVPA